MSQRGRTDGAPMTLFLCAAGEVFEARLVVEAGDPFSAGLEVQPERALHDGVEIGREAVDVAVEIRRKLVRVVEQAVEPAALRRLGHGESGEVEERDTGAWKMLCFHWLRAASLRRSQNGSAAGCPAPHTWTSGVPVRQESPRCAPNGRRDHPRNDWGFAGARPTDGWPWWKFTYLPEVPGLNLDR